MKKLSKKSSYRYKSKHISKKTKVKEQLFEYISPTNEHHIIKGDSLTTLKKIEESIPKLEKE
ncbi:MAG: hypothetical protein AABZ54_06005 [Bacteroidota bacterium]